MHPVFLIGLKHLLPWPCSLIATLFLILSSFLLVLWFDQDPLELVDCSTILVQ